QLVAFGLVVVLAAAHLILMPRTRYRIHRWEITPEVLYVQTGWLTRTRSIVALASLRAVETSHGPLTRVFGLTTVTVRSDSPVESVRIVGLGPSSAAHLRAELTRARA
ncbi:MAG: PH domain-containing protein, partial [Micrococcales bacterium]|nr:PH domain-containing protein [Micrococcales bacterium]